MCSIILHFSIRGVRETAPTPAHSFVKNTVHLRGKVSSGNFFFGQSIKRVISLQEPAPDSEPVAGHCVAGLCLR